MDIQLTQITKNTYQDQAGVLHIVSTKTDKEPWLRDHVCVDCKVLRRVNAATFTVGKRCPACWKKSATKQRAQDGKANALAIYAALKAQVKA